MARESRRLRLVRYLSRETNWDPKFALMWWDDRLLHIKKDYEPVRWFQSYQDAFAYVAQHLPDCSIEWNGGLY